MFKGKSFQWVCRRRSAIHVDCFIFYVVMFIAHVWIYDTWHVHFHVNIFFQESWLSKKVLIFVFRCTDFCNIWSICHKCCHHPAKITSQPTNQPTNQKKVKRFIFGQLNEMFIMIFLSAARTYIENLMLFQNDRFQLIGS